MTEEENHYPSPREAVFGNDHVGNLYCAVKYLAWHLSYTVFVVFGVALTAVAVPLFLLYRGLKFSLHYTAGKIKQGWQKFVQLLPGEWAVKTAEEFERRGGDLWNKASTKPVTRRIVNYCPVKFSMEPKWFNKLSDVGDRIITWAEPNKTVYVCDECGETKFYSHYEDGDDHYCGGVYRKTTNKKATEVHPDADA